jgi:hypothetical protein
MFAVHLLPGTDSDGTATWQEEVARGRSSAAFALLAGVSLALAHGRQRPLSGSAWAGASAGLLVRCALIGLLGLLLGGLGSGIAVILTYYAVLFALAAPLLTLGPRALAAAAVLVAVLVPIGSHLVRAHLQPKRGTSPVLADLAEPGVLLTELTLTGYYPVLPWLVYLAAGLAVGRLALDRRPVALRLAVGGALLVVGSALLSHALVRLDPARAALPENVTHLVWSGVTPPTTGWWLVTAEPHSATPLDLVHTTGSAVGVLGVMLLLAPLAGKALLPLAWLGSMTLTLYTVHVVAVADGVGPRDPEWLWVAHVLAALVIATSWRSVHPRGPLEHLVSLPSRAVATRVGRAIPG